jgi:hypothetical protein
MESKFTEEDKKKIVDFLNLVADKATFELTTNEVIKYYGLLSYMQRELIPKVNDNILEVIKVIEPKKKPAKKAAKGTK